MRYSPMKRAAFVAFACLMLGSLVTAADTELRRLESVDDGREWDAVGRLDLDGSGFCTGALIDVDLVLTAAHCLFDPDTGEKLNFNDIEFRAGWRNGRATAYRWVKNAVVHPDYDYTADAAQDRVRNDVALLQLMQPIRSTQVKPFETSADTDQDSYIGVVSYAHNRSEVPALQEMCSVMSRQSGILVMSCDVDFGSSGAPVFTFSGGLPKIVSVVSAKAEVSGDAVSLGTALDGPLDLLKDKIASQTQFTSANRRNKTGAKFVRP